MLALVCNTRNVDFKYMFDSKLAIDKDVIFFANKYVKVGRKKIYTSSVSKKNGLSYLLLLDMLLAFYNMIVILTRRVDIVVFDSAHISNLPLALLLLPFKVKQVYTIHDWDPHPGKSQRATEIYNNFVDKYLADEYIVFSDGISSEKPVHRLVLSGYPAADFDSHRVSSNTILFFGRIEPYKGVRHILSIAKSMPEYSFVVAGNGYDASITELSSLKNVEVINRFISDVEVKELFERAKLSILPYDSATQSGVLLLSYSYATPVVAFNVGCLSDYIDESLGILVPYGDTQRFCEAIKEVASSDSFCEERILHIFEERYSMEAMRWQYETLFKQLASVSDSQYLRLNR